MANENGGAPKGVLLLSGGFDSVVAGNCALSRGTELVAVHFSQEPFTDSAPEKKAAELAKILGLKKLIVVPLAIPLEEIAKKCSRKHYFVLMKRLFLRVAEQIAGREHCDFIVTGESLGQVSSQTLQNLSVIDSATKMLVVRPLLCIEKQEIIDLAKKIGTHDISVGKEECDALGPKHPSTMAKPEFVIEEEKKIGLERLVSNAISKSHEIPL
ncbi:MAG: hypothetical protein WC602_03265 [archaeon]